MGAIRVLKPGLQTTIQDQGRRGYEHYGVMVGGWLDDYAASWANRLLENDENAPVLEVTIMGPEFVAETNGWASLAGADLGTTINGEPWRPGTSRELLTGDHVGFGRPHHGARAYLGFAGGIEGDVVLGSRSTDMVGRFGGRGGRPLAAGDILTYAGGVRQPAIAPVETCIVSDTVRVLPGARVDRFPAGALDRMTSAEFRASPRSNQVGLRLEGPPVTTVPSSGDGISEGMAIGSVEVSPSGELLVLLKSRGSIGGYPTLAHVITADWPILAQTRPGDIVKFTTVSFHDARVALAERRGS